MPRHNLILRAIAAAFSLAIVCAVAPADTVTLKDGTVLEGKITREGDGFLYITIRVGGLEQARLILKSDIAKVMRDGDAPATTDKTPARPAEPAPTDAQARPTDPAPAKSATHDGAMRIAFITLEEEVGPFLNADALAESVKRLEGSDPDVVVLKFNSGGGAGIEIKPLSDVIEYKIKPKYTVVAWVESAISAAAMTAITCEDIYFKKEGNFGGCVGYRMVGERQAKAVEGEELEKILRQMVDISKRGNHDPLIMRAMQIGTELSCDKDPATDRVTWRNDLKGQYVVSTKDRILTLNALDAVKYGFGRAIVDSKDELAHALGATEWVEVGEAADAYQQEFRENVKNAQVKINELAQKMQIAVSFKQVPRARSFLGEIRSWVRRAPSLEEYMGLTPEWFREQEETLRKLAQEQSARSAR